MKREGGWYWVKLLDFADWSVMLWNDEDLTWLASGSEYPTYRDCDMREINERQIVQGYGGWVSVSDSLPRAGQLVDLHNGRRRFTDYIYFRALECFRSKSTGINYDVSKFTHWMPIQENLN